MANHLEYLDDLALQRIVDFLDYGSRRACRLVSSTLKDYIDKTGLSVNLDSREIESFALNKNVVATEVRILYLEPYDLEPHEVRKWKTIILSTPVNFTWLNDHMFPNCFQLRVLILNDDALIAENFRGKSEPIPSLSSLSELHITFNLWLTLAAQRLDDYDDLDRILRNIAYILKITRSRVLKVLYISVKGLEEEGVHGYWEHQPLHEFLQAHRCSLENLIIPTIIVDSEFSQSYEAHVNPTQLKRIQLATDSISGLTLDRFKYWTNLFLSQDSLENIAIKISHEFGKETPFPWFAVMVSNNAKTLTEISLINPTFDSDDKDPIKFYRGGKLDMRLFLVAESLRSLKLMYFRDLRIVNLNYLPTKSLTKLILLHPGEIGADFDGIKFLESSNLTNLYLDNVSVEGHFKDSHYTFQFVQLALRSRTLDKFNFYTTKVNHNSNWIQSSSVTVSELRLEPWIMQLEADDRLPNLSGLSMEMEYMEPGRSSINTLEGEPDYESGCSLSAPMSYMEMLDHVDEYEYYGCREPPFHLPMNMDSFVVWKQRPGYDAYRVLPITKSYSKKFKDMNLFKFFMSVVLERNGDASVGPAGLKDLGVAEDTLAKTDVITLGFQPKEIPTWY